MLYVLGFALRYDILINDMKILSEKMLQGFDLLISLDENTFNRIIASLYEKPNLKKELFHGTQEAVLQNVNVSVSWNVLAAPTVSLNPPSDSQWKNAYKENGQSLNALENAFVLTFPSLKIYRKQAGDVQETTIPVSAICSVRINPEVSNISVDAVGLIVDLSSAKPLDKLIYQNIIIPKILKLADSLLVAEQIPKINLHDAKFGKAVLRVGGGKVCAVANLENKSALPTIPDAKDLPTNRPFYVLFSREFVQKIATESIGSLVGKKVQTSGSKGFGIGDASYDATVVLNKVDAQVLANPTSVFANMNVSISANAGVDVFGPIIGKIVDAATYVAGGVVSVGTTIGNGVVDTANTVGNGVVDTANTVGGGIVDAGNAIGDFFSDSGY